MKSKLLLLSLAANLLLIVVLGYFVHSVGGAQYFLFRLTHGGSNGMSEGRQALFEQLPAQTGGVVMLGDSLVQNGEWNELLNHPNIHNRGIIGQWSGELLKRLEPILNLKAEKMFLMSGINDLKGSSPADAADTLRQIIERINSDSPMTTLFMQSVLPVNNEVRDTGRTNSDIVLLNEMLEKICGERICHWINLHGEFIDAHGNLAKDFTFDGVHLNGTAYLRWAELIEPYINPPNQYAAIR